MIFKNLKELSNKVFNNKECQKIAYIDGSRAEHEIWSNNKVFYLGYGRSWNANNVLPSKEIAKLTKDNFFFIRTGSRGSASDGVDHGVGYSVIYYSSGYSNGVYSHYGLAQNISANSNYCVVCTRPDKLIYLGSGSVDVKTLYPDKWQTFTIDNFLCSNSKYGAWRDLLTSGDEDDTFSSQVQVQISYNNGVISAYYVANGQTRGPEHDRDASATANMPIYLYKGKIIGL